MQTKPNVVNRNRLWKYVGDQLDNMAELTGTEVQDKPLNQSQDGTLRGSKRKRNQENFRLVATIYVTSLG